ncbi:hypothetical protein CPC08DRAFT_750957 [Agrocybe pediades]|nr:hypothetical protein CPC08DRAFT_750957 [Agrocybe pediades]
MRTSVFILTAVAVLAPSVAGKSTRSHGVVRRQATPSAAPDQCASTCSPFTQTLLSCKGDKTCLCTSAVQSNLQNCLNCLGSDTSQLASAAKLDANYTVAFNTICQGTATVTATGSAPTLTGTITGTGEIETDIDTASATDPGPSGTATDDSGNDVASSTADASPTPSSAGATAGSGTGGSPSGGSAQSTGAPTGAGAAGGSASTPANKPSAGLPTVSKGSIGALLCWAPSGHFYGMLPNNAMQFLPRASRFKTPLAFIYKVIIGSAWDWKRKTIYKR